MPSPSTTPHEVRRWQGRGEEGHEERDASRRQKPPPPQAFFRLYDEEDAEWGARQGSVTDPRPQERVQRHTMEHTVDFVWCSPMVQILDALVPQMVEQLPDVLRFFDALIPVPEQIIEVPKIILEDIPPRISVREPQLAEQLVEVPTIVSYSSLQRNMEQNVDLQFLVVEGEVLVFKVFFPDRVQQRCFPLKNVFLSGMWSRSSIFPVEAFKIFPQVRVHPLLRTFQLVLMMLWMRLVKGFFALFPKTRKVRSRVRTRAREYPLVLAHPRRLLSTMFVSRSGS